jgi:hypothetical protein
MVVVSFNQNNYEKQVEALQNSLQRYNILINCFNKITGDSAILKLEELNAIITKKTGFPNVEMSATLLGVETEYNYILENLNTYDLSNFILDDNGKATQVNKDVLNALKEANTLYLSKENETVFKQMQKAIDILNELNPANFQTIKQDYTGKFKINVMMLHNLSRL